jgi:hypothetical protein
VLIISILILLLAVTSSIEPNYNYLADYVKLNRIVFIIFILGAYLAYNTLNVDEIGSGIGIYGDVFKITVLSQVFDIILFITGSIVTILTCFIPYHFKIYNDSQIMESLLLDNSDFNKKLFNSNFKNYYYEKLLNYYNFNNYYGKYSLLRVDDPKVRDLNPYAFARETSFYINFFNFIKKITEYLPDLKFKSPYLVSDSPHVYAGRLEVKEYAFLLLYTVLGGSLLISSRNLISLYLSLELQSFTLYILSSAQIKSLKGTSGGLKYFLLGGLSSGFILLGSSLLYAYTGTLNIEHIFMIYSDSDTNYFIDPCLIILFSGLLFKVSAAPFHN